jgi:hypothetical protein
VLSAHVGYIYSVKEKKKGKYKKTIIMEVVMQELLIANMNNITG